MIKKWILLKLTIFLLFQEKFVLVVLVLIKFSFVLLNRTLLLTFNVVVAEGNSSWRKTNEGWGCIEEEAEGKFSMQCIKNNLQWWKEIALFIVQIIVLPRDYDNNIYYEKAFF